MITQDELPIIKIPSMNDMHLEEMLLVNKISTAAQSRDIEGVASAIEALYEHTVVHYEHEEKIMLEANYTDFAPHKAEHDRHIHELKSLMKYYDKNKEPKAVIAYIAGNLERWLIHHIDTMDRDAAIFASK